MPRLNDQTLSLDIDVVGRTCLSPLQSIIYFTLLVEAKFASLDSFVV